MKSLCSTYFINFLSGLQEKILSKNISQSRTFYNIIHHVYFKRHFMTIIGCTIVLSGSLSCLLCEPTSHQAVTFWGGLLAFVGMMSTSFANSILYLYIRYDIYTYTYIFSFINTHKNTRTIIETPTVNH